MRTGIYVHKCSKVTIHARDPHDSGAKLLRYNSKDIATALGTHKLEPGIYQVISRGELDVKGEDLNIQVMLNDKDTWPDPGLQVVQLEQAATTTTVQQFFELAKGITVAAPPAAPVSSATSKITDDPDGI